MTKLLWWLSPADIAAIGDPRETWPSWLREEYTSLRGRAGRGRLWVACEIFGHDTEVALALDAALWQTPMGRIAERCGGIMIREEDLPLLADLPGLVTDLRLRRHRIAAGAEVLRPANSAAHAAVAKDLAALLKAARLVCERAGEIGLARIEDDLLRARVEDLRDAVAEAEGR